LLECWQYDTAGNRTFFYKQSSMQMMCGYGVYPHYVYDTLGFLSYNWKRDRQSKKDTFYYFLLPQERKFGKIHSWGHEVRHPDTTIYMLDDEGRPVYGTGCQRYFGGSSWHYLRLDTIWYRYVGDRLSETEKHIVEPSNIDGTIETTHYYYTSDHLDSMVYVKRYTHPTGWRSKALREKTFYDKHGLPATGLIADSLRVYYLLTKCGDTSLSDLEEW